MERVKSLLENKVIRCPKRKEGASSIYMRVLAQFIKIKFTLHLFPPPLLTFNASENSPILYESSHFFTHITPLRLHSLTLV